MTARSLFPLLVAPHTTSVTGEVGGLAGLAGRLQSLLPGQAPQPQLPLLDLLYERKPFNSRADHRVDIRSQPLDLVLNPAVLRTVTEFFRLPEEEAGSAAHLSLQIRNAALSRLAEAQQRTREEVARNIQQILRGGSLDRKVWDVRLDLSAPKLLLPDHFEDKNSHLIVIDFGKLVLTNRSAERGEESIEPADRKQDGEEEEELFLTPASSPGPEDEDRPQFVFPEPGPGEGEEALLHNAMYDRYNMDLQSMQVLVCRAGDSWRGAHTRGNSALHLVDSFSIALSLERRTVETVDPAWPALVLAATLPSLQLHFNEEKLGAAQRGVARLLGPQQGRAASRETACQTGQEEAGLWAEWEGEAGETGVSSKLLVAHFCVSDLSAEVQAAGKSVAEVQVTNMKAGLTRRPYDTNLSLSVHSLLVVDALQTFGPDYELLVASHRSVCVDAVSGALRGSHSASPSSPAMPADPPPSPRLPSSELPDPAALISIELLVVSPRCPTLEEDDELRILTVQFNSLDVIANQETIIELLGLARRVFPAGPTAGQPQFTG